MQRLWIRSQASMEFLMSYGWALLVVLIVIAVLAIFGILDVDKVTPDKAELDRSVVYISDFKVTNNRVYFLVLNSGSNTVLDFQINATNCETESEAVDLAPGETQLINIYCGNNKVSKSRFKSDLVAHYSISMAGNTLDHVNHGKVVSLVVSAPAYLEYEEDADENATEGQWTNPDRLNDGSWHVLSRGYAGEVGTSYYYANYTIPPGALESSMWQVYDTELLDNILNFSLSDHINCWNHGLNEGKLIFRASSRWNPSNRVTWDCKDSETTWENMRDVAPLIEPSIVEEAMWWNLTG